jgi:histidine triad (HIT) family protein
LPKVPTPEDRPAWSTACGTKKGLKNMSDCIFCKIIKKEIPGKLIDETEQVAVYEDINPKTPIHYLIIPKIHIENMGQIQDTEEHNTAVLEMVRMVAKLAKNLPDEPDFTLVSNNGTGAGQSVLHMHWHFLAGKSIYSDEDKVLQRGIKL